MAAISQPADQEVGDLRQAMKGDGQIHAAADSTAELNPGHDGNSSECSGEAPGDNNDAPRANGVHEGAIDPAMYYAANGYGPHTYVYEYPQGAGYEPPAAEWDEYTRYVDGCEVQSPAFSENGSAVYVHGYGYSSQPGYSYAPGAIPTIGADGQLYGPQPYQYPGHIYPQSVAPGGQYVQSSPVISGELPGGGGEPGPPGVDGSNPALANGNGGPMGHRPGYPLAMMQPHAPYRGVLPMTMHNTGHQDVRVFDNTRGGNNSWADMTKTAEGQQRPGNPTQGHVGTSQSVSPPVQATGQTGRPNSAVQVNMQASQQPQRAPTSLASSSLGPGALARGYPPLGRPSSAAPNGTGRAGRGQGGNGLETRSIGRGWPGTEKSGKPRGRGTGLVGNGNGNLDILNEQNRGPRTTRARSQRTAPAVLRHTRGQGGSANGNCDALSFLANREQYNRPDFPTKYEHARFFVIKSYSEDDVHKSIKYNVWASTPNGNKRLELAYQEAQTRHGGKPGGCPVFFFFSVNASGQFCGVAEMAGSVDFNKSVDFWQQDKWNGRFSVKWHIIKDIPNCQFRHIILENNDNKPVTNSRDTQEVKFDQGLEMLNIFKSYTSKTSILDDFQFYENRQRAMQEKRTRQQAQQQRERQQGGLQLPGDTGQGVLDDSTGKFNKIEKSPDLAEENGCAKPRILGKGELNSRHPPPPPGDNTELPTQRLGQLRLSDARDDSSASDDKKIGDVKPATCEREAVLVVNTALSNDKVGLVKQEQ